MPSSAVNHGMTARPKYEDRRKEPRLLCADLVTVYWYDELGNPRKSVANLEDVSHRGACLLMDLAIAPESEVRIDTGRGHYLGSIRHSTPFATSYLLGVQFQPGCEWEASRFQPAHLFDPQSLLAPEETPEQSATKCADQPTAATGPGEPALEPCAEDLQRLLRILRSDFAR